MTCVECSVESIVGLRTVPAVSRCLRDVLIAVVLVDDVDAGGRIRNGDPERACPKDHPVVPARAADGERRQFDEWTGAREHEVVEPDGTRPDATGRNAVSERPLPRVVELELLVQVEVPAAADHEMVCGQAFDGVEKVGEQNDVGVDVSQ